MSAKCRRYLGSKSGDKKKFLEKKNLEFLKGIPFFAVVEYKKGKKKEILIEFEPKPIKKLVSKAKEAKKLRSEGDNLLENVNNLEEENKTLRTTFKKYEAALSMLGRDYKLVAINKDKKMNPRDKSPMNFFSIIEKYGYPLRGLPFQGGSPS
jgi:predicted RNase H-like nuclease (RuvC/YqgF family)